MKTRNGKAGYRLSALLRFHDNRKTFSYGPKHQQGLLQYCTQPVFRLRGKFASSIKENFIMRL
jgi:hypothetical protein